MKQRVKHFAGAILIYILGVVCIASVSYVQERERFLMGVDARLLAAASNIPEILPYDFHDIARSPDAISAEQDQYNLDLMTRHANSGSLTYLYSYVMVDGMIYFTSCNYTQDDLDKDQVVTYWTDYPEGAKKYFDAMTATEPVYVTAGDRWGLFRTILMPMTSPSGLPYVAAADMDITVIESTLTNAVLSVVEMSVLLLVIAIPLILAYRRTYSEMNSELIVLNKQLQADIQQATVLEAELKQATHDANEANEIKSQFLSNMSHELRTPINGISGMNHLLLDTDLTEEQLEYVEMCNKSAEVLLDIVNQILDVAAIEASGLSLHPQPVMTDEFFNNILALFSGQLAEEALELTLSYSRSVPVKIQLDPIQFRKVMINLISNAIKFTKEGGVWITIDWKEGYLIGEIKDSGCGIAALAHHRIFEVFQQADNSHTRKHTGTGLGLPISRQICQLMDGDVELKYSDDTGSCFRFHVKTRACDNTMIPHIRGDKQKKVYVYSESNLMQGWLLSELDEYSLEFISTIKVLKGICREANLVIVDAAITDDDLRSLASKIGHHQQLVLLSWIGRQLPEDLQHKVHLLRKPVMRSDLVSAMEGQRIT